MAITFENVVGNQTSANVLAQINNNFAKINSTPVPKADFATNADTVDNKHASDLLPGAATFMSSITALSNLSVGRYFCTQTRQSWEPVATTGSRTFLIEVSLNTPNNLKSYKINYIAGAGAGESYYADYGTESIRWNRIINSTNVGNITEVKNTYDDKDRPGRVVTYEDMIVYQEDKELVVDDFISTNDGTGNYYQFSASCSFSNQSGSGCNTSYYWNLYATVKVYNSNFGLIRTVSSPGYTMQINGPSTYSGRGIVIGQIINQTNGDAIIGVVGEISSGGSSRTGNAPPGLFYFSTATNSIMFVQYGGFVTYDYSGYNTMQTISYWYNNHFGFVRQNSNYVYLQAIELNATRNGIVYNQNTNIVSSISTFFYVGQKDQNIFFSTGTGSGQALLTKVNIPTRSVQSISMPTTGTYGGAQCTSGMSDDSAVYVCVKYQTDSSTQRYKVFKYNDSLILLATSVEFIGEWSTCIILTQNYVVSFSSNQNSAYPARSLNKSNLSLVSTYNKYLYMPGFYNPTYSFFTSPRVLMWWKQEYFNTGVNAVYVAGDYVLTATKTTFYNGNTYSNYAISVPLCDIINVANGSTLGYFANTILYSKLSDAVPCYIEGLGLCFRKKSLIASSIEYLLKSFKR